MSLFVDSSAWYAATDAGDRNIDRARAILSAGERLVTTDHVLIESWLLLRHRLGRSSPRRFWEGLRAGVATIEMVRSADLETVWALGFSRPGLLHRRSHKLRCCDPPRHPTCAELG